MAGCDPDKCPTSRQVTKVQKEWERDLKAVKEGLLEVGDKYDKTHVAMEDQRLEIAKQTTTLELFIGEVRRDRQERRESEKKLFEKAEDNKVEIQNKADKDSTISRNGVLMLIGILTLIFGTITFIINMSKTPIGG
jgi:hypothetical protein